MSGQITSLMQDSRLSRAEAVARTIETEISNGTIAAGDRLGTKDTLKRRFNVAVATLNEAIKLLDARGLVEARPGPGGGVFVASATVRSRQGPLIMGFQWAEATMADYHEVRGVLEPTICRHAADHHSDAEIEVLQEIVTEMTDSLNDPASYMRLNTAFHRQVAAISPNAPLRSLYLTVLDFFENAVDPSTLPTPLHHYNVEIHQSLLDAIVVADKRRLNATLRAHDAHRRAFGLSLHADDRADVRADDATSVAAA